jgi:hypothetical protein
MSVFKLSQTVKFGTDIGHAAGYHHATGGLTALLRLHDA